MDKDCIDAKKLNFHQSEGKHYIAPTPSNDQMIYDLKSNMQKEQLFRFDDTKYIYTF